MILVKSAGEGNCMEFIQLSDRVSVECALGSWGELSTGKRTCTCVRIYMFRVVMVAGLRKRVRR